MIRYKVKPDQAETNVRLVQAVYEELRKAAPAGVRYATFQLDDGVSFVHIHSDDSTDGANALTALPAFKRFQEGIPDRCEEGPVVSAAREVGSFRFFAGQG
jgi:hypothetical protein